MVFFSENMNKLDIEYQSNSKSKKIDTFEQKKNICISTFHNPSENTARVVLLQTLTLISVFVLYT